MPEVGEIKRGREIGKAGDSHKHMWVACETCGKERWVMLRNGELASKICIYCAGKKASKSPTMRGKENHHPNWKGGRIVGSRGYIAVKLYPDDFFYPMVDRHGYVLEHRLVMARFLGRCLHRWEIIHHKNHIKDDNRTENLQLVSDDRHKQITVLERRIKYLEDKIRKLEARDKK